MDKQRLGKGLSALIPGAETGLAADNAQLHVDVNFIDPNPFQPRKDFGSIEMQELIDSIKAKGILQPLSVREMPDGRYQLVAGERRLRAAKEAGLKKVPVNSLSIDSDVDLMEYALIENIQRENLNPVEQAEAFALLHSKFDLKQDEIARRVGKSRSAVANFLRLLKLPADIKQNLIDGDISMGHARSLLALPQPALMQKLCRKILKEGLSVRQTEAVVQTLSNGGPAVEAPSKSKDGKTKALAVPTKTSFINHVEVELLSRLRTKVRVKPKDADTGSIEIAYYSQDDLERILDIIIGEMDEEPAR